MRIAALFVGVYEFRRAFNSILFNNIFPIVAQKSLQCPVLNDSRGLSRRKHNQQHCPIEIKSESHVAKLENVQGSNDTGLIGCN